MTKKKLDVWALAEGVTLSEPLLSFLRSIEATESVVQIIVDRGETTVKKIMLEQATARLKLDIVERESKKLSSAHKMTGIEQINNFIKEANSALSYSEQLSTNVMSQFKVLLPMIFVYRFTLWDAFILDMGREILRAHPQLIWTRGETMQASKSILWNTANLNEVRDYIINQEVSQLAGDRKKLIKTFRDYWGIDWKKSGQSLDYLREVIARRDIWVHNYGKINEQYLSMIGDKDYSKIGKIAKITPGYLVEQTYKLVELSIYIHKLAYEKHYKFKRSQ